MRENLEAEAIVAASPSAPALFRSVESIEQPAARSLDSTHREMSIGQYL